MSAIGSEGWQDAGVHAEDGVEVQEFVQQIDWSVICKNAEEIRSIPCTISPRYTRGRRNVVRKLEFSDGVQWIVRLHIPHAAKTGGAAAEHGAMELLRQHTSIPVSEAHAYILDADMGFQFLTYIHGTRADRLAETTGHDLQNDTAFWTQMANIQTELARCTFEQIGSVNVKKREFFINSDAVTYKGPWNTATEYWQDLAQEIQNTADQVCDQETKASPSFQIPQKFLELMNYCGRHDQDEFRLVHRDLGIHNVLVNDNFEIVGLIGLRNVIAAPIEMVAQLPRISGLDRPLPGSKWKDHGEPSSEWKDRAMPMAGRYVGALKSAAAGQNDDKYGAEEVIDRLESDGAKLVRGLLKFKEHNLSENEAVWKEYEKLAEIVEQST
ncbi:hypothetical protein BST61_g10316 [Cercospora zeina]